MTSAIGLRYRTALVVDDHAVQRRLAEAVLRLLGVGQVLGAGSSEQALSLAREHQPELLLCDIDMPGTDGIALLRQLAQLPQPPAVVVISAVDAALLRTVGQLARQFGLEVLGALPKPVGEPTLGPLLLHSVAPPEGSERYADPHRGPLAESVLEQALAERWFVPYYEPKVDRRSGRVLGAEVLARLQPPSGEPVSPSRFIAALERMGRINPMLWQLAEQSFRFAGQLTDQGWPIQLSFNLAPQQLLDDQLVERFVDLLREHGLSARQITLEITESAAIDAREQTLERLARLRLRGFGLSVDDFGTGYSSLAQLSSVPFSELKIDRSFSAGAVDDYRARAVVESCLDLARRMSLKTCAEGVETLGIFHLLQDLRCDTFQGYLFSRPRPEASFLTWAREWNASGAYRDLCLSEPPRS
ncbi:MAG TPA: EAL domain-containing response regulator [Nevskiaceae bacterium]|nr:EAL domain-containing response regulator [Nevskiaceae bacterium]